MQPLGNLETSQPASSTYGGGSDLAASSFYLILVRDDVGI